MHLGWENRQIFQQNTLIFSLSELKKKEDFVECTDWKNIQLIPIYVCIYQMWEGIWKLCFSNNYAGYLFHFSVCLKYLTCTKLYLQAIEVATSSITESCSVLSLNIRQQYYCGIIQIGYPSPNLSMKTWPFNIFIIVHYIYIYMQIRYFHFTESLKIIDEIWPPQI